MTAADIVKNENEWTRFLTTAARLGKVLPFIRKRMIFGNGCLSRNLSVLRVLSAVKPCILNTMIK